MSINVSLTVETAKSLLCICDEQEEIIQKRIEELQFACESIIVASQFAIAVNKLILEDAIRKASGRSYTEDE